jgi:cytochrome P450
MPAIPSATLSTAWHALNAWQRGGHILGALEAVHEELGDVFRLPLPGFDGIFLVGPEANKFLLTEARDHFRWRAEDDPVTRLLKHGLLVEDGETHHALRGMMTPAFHKNRLAGYIEIMQRRTDQVTDGWHDGDHIDLLVEMRRIALLILMDTLFAEDFSQQLAALWHAILRTIRYISPGPWLVWPGIPRPGYRRALRQMDEYLYRLISHRRGSLATENTNMADDLLSQLIASGMSDDLIRDQLLTLLIAGHDTSTAQLAWSLYLLLTHKDILAGVRAELAGIEDDGPLTSAQIKQMEYLDCVLKETARLYPPIHLGSRIAASDLSFRGYRIPAGTRVLYSIYLTHRQKQYWSQPERFDPERFNGEPANRRPAYAYVPFGGGPRNCIGAAFAQVEAKVVLARILQQFDLHFAGRTVRPRMRATLEPSPGVLVKVRRRS